MNHYYLYGVIVMSMITAQSKEEYLRYLWTNFQQFEKKYDEALSGYQQLISAHSPGYMYKGYLHLLQEMNQWEPIAALIPVLDQTFSEDSHIQLLFAAALEQIGRQHEADERIIRLNRSFPKQAEIAFSAAQVYMRRRDNANALTVIDNYLNAVPQKANHFLFYFVKAQLLVQLDNKEAALVQVKKSLDLYPHFDKSWLLYALLNEQAGMLEQAIQGYVHFIQVTQEPTAAIQTHVAQLILHNRTQESTNTEELLDRARSHAAQGDLLKARELILGYLAMAPGDMSARVTAIDMLATIGDFNHAISLLTSWITEQPTEPLWHKTLHLLGMCGCAHDQIINAFVQVERKIPHAELPTLYLADLYLRTNQSTAAKTYLNKALKKTAQASTKAKILYQLALISYQERHFNLMQKQLTDAIKFDPSFTPNLNLLSYYYASKTTRYAQAHELIEKALKSEPNNPHYLDTKGLIMYKQKNYAAAQQLFEQSFSQEPHDSTVIRHLAKTLYQNDNRLRARELLDTALGMARSRNDTVELKKLTTLATRWNHDSH